MGNKIRTEWPEITSGKWQFDIPWLIVSLFMLLSLYLGHACGWLIILKRFNHPVPFLPGLYVWCKSLLARYIPGNVMMVLGRVMMIEPYGVPKRVSLTSVAYEQALLLSSAATVIAVALPLWPKLQNFSQWIWLVLVVPPLAVIFLHPAVLNKVGNFALRKLKRETIEDFLPFKDIVGIFFFYCIFWIVAGMGLFAMAQTVTYVSWSNFPIFVASTPLAWLSSVLFFISPSGLGVREGVYAYTLDFAFPDSSGEPSLAIASAFAIIIRFWQTLVEIVAVAVVMALVKIRHIKIKAASVEEVPEEDDLHGRDNPTI